MTYQSKLENMSMRLFNLELENKSLNTKVTNLEGSLSAARISILEFKVSGLEAILTSDRYTITCATPKMCGCDDGEPKVCECS